MATSERRICDPCSVEEEKPSKAYCETCDEFLCEECLDFHKVQDLTSGHTFTSVSDKLNCNICSKLKVESKPSKFCQDCRIWLCAKCCTKHARQTASKNHTFSTNSRHKTDMERASDDFQDTVSKQETTSNRTKVSKVIPGTPKGCNISSDSIDLHWMKPLKFNKEDTYQIGYKESNGKWKIHPNDFKTSKATVTDLKSNTGYIFRVRVVNDGNESPYSQTSEEVKTLESLALKLLPFSRMIGDGEPKTYSPPLAEIWNARDESAKTKKVEIGMSDKHTSSKERTLMLVGATGTGKSTLVDGIVNYVLGVNFDDPFRYTIVQLEDEEKRKRSNQAESQTEWITCYTIHPDIGGCLDYSLNIIDTPGFGDTRGIKHDKRIVDQIHKLFSSREQKGVLGIDAVCFMIKAPDARLTATQVYVFESIMGLFGKNIADNICSLITFADGMDPPVLAALKESKLPYGRHFTFNNSGLFAKNSNLNPPSLSSMFWDMGKKSFCAFFDRLKGMNV